MIKRILLLSSLAVFMACKPNKVTNSAADSTKATNTSATGKTLPTTGLTGIWVKENDDNPAFEIKRDSVYYPDHAAPYPYETSADSIMIHYKGFTDTFKSQLKSNDTLILSNKLNGKHVYHRYKN
jgi:hypothetical protein